MANKFYVHNDIFRYEDEVFGDSEAELDEGKIVTYLLQTVFLLFEFLVHVLMLKCEDADASNSICLLIYFLSLRIRGGS